MKESISKELVAKVKANFDLNEYESKVWISLLSKGISSVGEIAEISGVPRSRVYDVLESLEKRGFVIMKLGKPIKYIAVKPDEVIERIKANLLNEAKERIKIFDKIKETEEYNELEKLFNQSIKPINVEDVTTLIKGKFNINHTLKSSIKEAKKSIIIVTTVNNLSEHARILKPLIPKLNKDKIKLIVAASGDEKIGKKISRELGIKIRKIDFDARFCIIDGKEVFIMTNDGTDMRNDYAIFIKSNFFASSLLNLLSNYLNNTF